MFDVTFGLMLQSEQRQASGAAAAFARGSDRDYTTQQNRREGKSREVTDRSY
jgi:hypothetical protein